jgi:xylitol oxidase
MTNAITNWARNITFGAERLHGPTSVEQLQRLVAGSDRIRTLGTGHSFNRIADTTGDLVTVADLPRTVEIDPAGRQVRVSGGMRYGELGARLQAEGLALHNMGSLPHISVAGACSTGTHGSGVRNRNLAAAVSAVELVTADGDLVTVRRGDDDFPVAVLALGAVGVITHLTLDVEPTYDVRQTVYDRLPFEQFRADPMGVLAAGYSVSAFTTWQDDVFDQVWVKQRVEEEPLPAQWRGASAADGPRNPVPGMPAVHATEQGGVPGPWIARLPHFRLEFTPSNGEELQSEWFVPQSRAAEAFDALASVRSQIAPVLQICEIRTIAADDMWLSPAYDRDSVALHFTWVQDTPAVTPVLGAIESALAGLDARPHWAKLFTMSPDVVAARYPRFDDARRVLSRYDPKGVFRNELLDTYLPPIS